jgi:hypothetical protein
MLDFLGIGAQKAGTTWLYEQLRQHPQLTFPLGKEAHFWNRPHDDAAIADYLSRFNLPAAPEPPRSLLTRWLPRRRRLSPPRRAGEITPAYGMLPPAVIQDIHRHVPNLRLLYLIRNPIERAWSAALMALERAEMTIDEASDAWFIDHFHSAGSRGRGDYRTCLRNWRAVFPNEQLLILRFEEMADAPEALLNRCFQHLGVAPLDPEQLRRQGCRERVFAGPGHPLRPGLRRVLLNLYREPVEQLADDLNMDLHAWLN